MQEETGRGGRHRFPLACCRRRIIDLIPTRLPDDVPDLQK
jgi:hypothetical protein